jgi:hypothetical protein
MNSIIEAQIELKEQQLFEMERCLDAEYLIDTDIKIKMTGHIMDIEKGLLPIWEISDKGTKESFRYKFKKDGR